MTFQMLLTSGRDTIDALTRRLIDLYICDSAATDAISARLRDVCPSLFSCADELYSKVTLAYIFSMRKLVMLGMVRIWHLKCRHTHVCLSNQRLFG